MKAEVKWIAGSSGFEEIKLIDVEDYKVQSNTGLFDELREMLGSYSYKYSSGPEGVMNK